MSVNRLLQEAASGAATGEESDENFKNVVLLLDGDGTNGDDNNTYTDESSNSRTVTANNNPRQGSFTPYGDRWSIYYDGSSSTQWAGGTNYRANTTAFTVECFAKGTATGTNVFVGYGITGNSSASSWWLETVSGVMKFYVSRGGSYSIASDTVSFSDYGDEWVHIAGVIDNGTAKLYMNGVLKGTVSVSSVNTSIASSTPVSIGAYQVNSTYPFEGYISHVRIHQSVVYSGSSFDVPTTMRRDSATLWVNQGHYFDSGYRSHGTYSPPFDSQPRIVPHSAVKNDQITTPSDDVDIANGGSVYFNQLDNVIDWLGWSASGYNSVTDLTVSFWVYPESMQNYAGGYPRVFASGAYTSGSNFLIYMRDDDIRVYRGGERVQTPLNKYEWTHIHIQRSSGIWTIYKNGSAAASSSSDTTAIRLDTTNSIGSEVGNYGMKGYVAGFRITTSASTSTAYPGNSLLTDVADTQLLMNFKDAGIYDKAGLNNLETVGDAQVDTAVTKYGTGSIQFDGAGDILRHGNPADKLALGTGDFTVEFWMNIPNVSATQVFFDMRHDSNTNDALTVFVSGGFQFFAGTSSITIGTISNDTWHHIAIVRDGSTIRSFIDGVAGGTETNTNDLTCEEFRIGARWDNGTPMTGYIDDFRITKGVARYTSAFTPPTKALPKF